MAVPLWHIPSWRTPLQITRRVYAAAPYPFVLEGAAAQTATPSKSISYYGIPHYLPDFIWRYSRIPVLSYRQRPLPPPVFSVHIRLHTARPLWYSQSPRFQEQATHNQSSAYFQSGG